MKTIKFKSWNCKIVRKFYANDRPALELIDANDGSPILKATVNLPEYSLNEDEVFIKDWSENAGIYNVLVNEGIISEATEIVPTGFVHALKCKLLFKF